MLHLSSSAKETLVSKFVSSVSGIAACREIYRRAKQKNSGNFVHDVLSAMNVTVETNRHELVRIPTSGACVVVANHPKGGVEGLAILDVLLSRRSDVKVLVNGMLAEIEELREYFYFVNPFGDAEKENRRGMREALLWLKQGGMIVVFPAGEVSTFRFDSFGVADKDWDTSVVRMAIATNAKLLPCFVHGSNSVLFHVVGSVHPMLRTAQLAREFVASANEQMRCTFGNVIASSMLAKMSAEEATTYLRERTYILKHKSKEQPGEEIVNVLHQEIAEEMPGYVLAHEIDALPYAQLLLRHNELCVYEASAPQIPQVLKEIGRLREITFRYAGEGTGLPRDTDAFDAWYTHIFIWNSQTSEIVGAYRVAKSDEVLSRYGISGLYTSTLFEYSQSFFTSLKPAIELGRSFIRIEYQRSYSPLLLLWKGIGEYVVRNPAYRILFGPVSISNDYSLPSKRLMVRSLRSYHANSALSKKVKARHPLPSLYNKNWDLLHYPFTDVALEKLQDIVPELEHTAKGIPILLKQYLKLGAEVVSFNVDKKFSDVIDALIVVDLDKTDDAVLSKYMGNDGATQYRTQSQHSI